LIDVNYFCLSAEVIVADQSVGVSLGAVSVVLARASSSGLTWEAVESIDDEELERRNPSTSGVLTWARWHLVENRAVG
jgi:hypothetical protein